MAALNRMANDFPERRPRGWLLGKLVAASLLCLSLAGCLTGQRTVFTAEQQAAATPVGFDHIRYNDDDPALAEMLRRTLKPDGRGVVNALAISGGGANGAYGAGLLFGWDLAGRRPDFQLVTGISAGAMAAPLVFAGAKWDSQLRQTYFNGRTHKLLQGRGLMGILTPGLYSKAPLEALVRTWVTDDLLRDIAAEHDKGRRLLVATTNLDTGQLVVWDMGGIAAHGGPEARALFISVLVASASVPGVFAPSMIRVHGVGRDFEEMHVDGQADSAFFAIPQAILLAHGPAAAHADYHLFVIVNGQLNSAFQVTPLATAPILGRTVETAAKASIRSALLTTLEFCRRNGCDLEVSTVPPELKDDSLDFSDAHIQSLFDAGETAAEQGRAWTTAAPAITTRPAPTASPP